MNDSICHARPRTADLPCVGRAALFFGPEHEAAVKKERREAAARALCATCPARLACLDRALAGRDKHGVWGGLVEARVRDAIRHGWTRPRVLLPAVLAVMDGLGVAQLRGVVLAAALRAARPELTGLGESQLGAALSAYGARPRGGYRRRADVVAALVALRAGRDLLTTAEAPGGAVGGWARGRRIA